MKHLFASLVIALFLTAVTSCDNSTSRLLDDVESYIQTRPDSALEALRSIDTLSLRSAALKGKYSLLSAMAFDKNYIDTTDLSVIRDAEKYYLRKGSPDYKLKTLYYKGNIYYNRREKDKAIFKYSRAMEYEEEASRIKRNTILP